jgi:hypothetical protein
VRRATKGTSSQLTGLKGGKKENERTHSWLDSLRRPYASLLRRVLPSDEVRSRFCDMSSVVRREGRVVEPVLFVARKGK